MQMNLFGLHCRGAPGYASQPNCSEAERNASGFGRFAIAEAHQYMRRSRIASEAKRNASLPATAGTRRYMRPMSLHLDILRRSTFKQFPANRYFPAKHRPRLDPTEPRAGCVIDTGVLKLTVSASAAGLSGTCKACRCGGCFAGRAHAGTGNAPAG